MRHHKNKSTSKSAASHNTGLPRFFTKQLLAFLLLAFLVVIIDLFIYIFIALSESGKNFDSGTPAATMRVLDDSLSSQDGIYTLAEKGAEALAIQNAWAILVDNKGDIIWSENQPSDVPLSYNINDIAMIVHYANIADYPAFFWSRSDGLLILGFPQESYWHMGLSLPESTIRAVPLYVLLILGIDLAIFFAAYLISRRRTQGGVLPIVEALDDLSQGHTTVINLKGDLREISQKITDVSAVIECKDTARANWIRGVSHDIRTPLSMILGYADGIAEDTDLQHDVRSRAAVIRTQGLKIKDLVTDLNMTTQLDYDMQPLSLERIHLARLLRNIAATYMNEGLSKQHPLDVFVHPRVEDAVVLGDARLLTRALENALTNARLHNKQGCSLSVTLIPHAQADVDTEEPIYAAVRIADDGEGVSEAVLTALDIRLMRSRIATAPGANTTSPESSTAVEHGLGLVLIDRIARAHGGTLIVHGAPGEGFSVELVLPLA